MTGITYPKPTSHRVLADFPAYSIHEPPVFCGPGTKVIRAGIAIMILVPGRYGGWKKFLPGSVVSSALEYDEDPIAAVEREKSRGHPLKWINGCAVSITSHRRAKEAYFGFNIGDRVTFEGETFTLFIANGHVGLMPVTEKEEA